MAALRGSGAALAGAGAGGMGGRLRVVVRAARECGAAGAAQPHLTPAAAARRLLPPALQHSALPALLWRRRGRGGATFL